MYNSWVTFIRRGLEYPIWRSVHNYGRGGQLVQYADVFDNRCQVSWMYLMIDVRSGGLSMIVVRSDNWSLEKHFMDYRRSWSWFAPWTLILTWIMTMMSKLTLILTMLTLTLILILTLTLTIVLTLTLTLAMLRSVHIMLIFLPERRISERTLVTRGTVLVNLRLLFSYKVMIMYQWILLMHNRLQL